MAYINQEKKKTIAQALKFEFAGLKFSLSIKDNRTLIVKLYDDFNFKKAVEGAKQRYLDSEYCVENGLTFESEGGLESAIKNGVDVIETNESYKYIFKVIKKAGGWFDHSDIITDYYHTAFYIDLKVHPSK